MFRFKSLNKKGFGHVEIIIFVVVILAIGGIGYFALNSSKATNMTPCTAGVYKNGSPKIPCVNFIQRMLNGINVVEGPNKDEILKVDGVYGSKTVAAVKSFQKRQGYKNQTGVVDKITWNVICTRVVNIYNKDKNTSNYPRIENAAKAGKRAGCTNTGYKDKVFKDYLVYNVNVGEEVSDAIWERVAQCESGGRWNLNTGNGFYGGLQFMLSTWHSVGGTGYPHQATKKEQIKRANIILRLSSWEVQWPNCNPKDY